MPLRLIFCKIKYKKIPRVHILKTAQNKKYVLRRRVLVSQRIAPQLRCSRNPPNIRNPLIYLRCKSLLLHVFGGNQSQMPYRASTNSTCTFVPLAYSSQLLTVLGNGITSRMLDIPVRYITQRSKPSPKPAWRVEPYLRRSR